MIDKTIIKSLIVEYQQSVSEKKVMRRNHTFDEHSNYVLVGIRRAGKSFLLYQDIQDKIQEGKITEKGFVYINFEDERLAGIELQDLNMLLVCYNEMYSLDKPWVYLDEIQNVEGWEKFARRLVDQGYRVMITGSNAKMLSGEIASRLGGRYISHEVYPFSFGEYLQYKGVEMKEGWQYDNRLQTKIRKMFDDYFLYGGFAENFDRQDKREWLNSLYQKILLGDVIARNAIRNVGVFRLIARKLADSVGQPMTQTRLQNIVRSMGENISLTVLRDYLEYMQEAYLTFGLSNWTSSLSERSKMSKRYFMDNGLLNVFYMSSKGKMLENMVAIDLYKRYHLLDEVGVYYYNKNIEVDFCVPQEGWAVQTTLDLNDMETYERETRALGRFLKANGEYKGIILSLDSEQEIEVEGRKVEVMPVWKWLLR
jgi:uncharacterized protein